MTISDDLLNTIIEHDSTTISYPNMCINITVGSGHNILIIGCRNALVPNPHHSVTLNNVLHAPKLIRNLVSLRKLTTDNNIFVEFDHFGFSLKNFQTKILFYKDVITWVSFNPDVTQPLRTS